MATKIYNTVEISLFDGSKIEVTPLKIKYLREFMEAFHMMKIVKNDEDAILILLECVRISMKQFMPELSVSIDILEDNVDMPTIYKILDACAGIKINQKSDEGVKSQAESSESATSWEEFDLAKIESEIFLLGIWKDYDELERSLSLPEIMATLENKRELDYQEKKFVAAIQGVDLEKGTEGDPQKKWEDMKARVFSRGMTEDSNDVLALQGQNAKKAGFGIGLGLDYEDLRNIPSTQPSMI